MPGLRRLIPFLLLILTLLPSGMAGAQAQPGRPPVEMMVLIDNSCSMFPANQILAGCDAYGSDVSFLRIAGANLFIARLGFGETNEDGYKLGVISIGDEPELVSPLLPLKGMRDTLAGLISEPKAQPATRIVPALEQAYVQLEGSNDRAQSSRIPAIVMITDGVPWPREDQSDAVIEKLVSAHPETPLFIMLLQNKEKVSLDYENYIKFWEHLQSSNHHIFVYRLEHAEEIQSTYNSILGQLQNTIPAETSELMAQSELKFTVSEYLERLVITVMRKNARSEAGVTILDGNNKPVQINDQGVEYFKGTDNPVDVYSIQTSRLDQGGRDKAWTIKSSRDVTILIDREGSYSINILTPKTTTSNLEGIYSVVERQSPSIDLRIRFNLIDGRGDPVTARQPVNGSVVFPDGSSAAIAGLDDLAPDQEGTYEFGYALSKAYPEVENTPGRFAFIISAGVSDDLLPNSPPVAIARVQVDVGKLPFIRSIAPLPVICEPGQPSSLRVNLGDFETALDETIRVTLLSGDGQLNLEQTEPGVYSADIQTACSQLLLQQPCSTDQNVAWGVRLEAKLGEGYAMEPEDMALQAQVLAPACTPTPLPTVTPTPMPVPTPLPDSDQDGLLDQDDKCPSVWGWAAADGCVPWVNIASGLGILGVVVLSSSFAYSWVKVRSFGEPPQGYLIALRDGKVIYGPVDLYQLGRKKRATVLKVGGDRRKVHIHLPGLKPVEFNIERKSVITYLRDPAVKEGFAFLSSEAETIHTSDPRLVLKVSMDQDKLTGEDSKE